MAAFAELRAREREVLTESITNGNVPPESVLRGPPQCSEAWSRRMLPRQGGLGMFPQGNSFPCCLRSWQGSKEAERVGVVSTGRCPGTAVSTPHRKKAVGAGVQRAAGGTGAPAAGAVPEQPGPGATLEGSWLVMVQTSSRCLPGIILRVPSHARQVVLVLNG